jgi:hypothetical protein
MNTPTAIIPTDSPSIFDILSSLSTLQQRAIVRPNNPPPGLAGFLFDVPENDEITLRSNITDSYVEKNYAIQDNIALAPEEYTLRGLVAELAAINVNKTQEEVAAVNNPLPIATFLLPAQITGLERADAVTGAADRAEANSAQSLFSLYLAKATPPPNQTKQARVFGYFYQLWLGRQLVSIETPWGTMTNMGIGLVKAVQGEDSRFFSTFTVTFKKIRTVTTITVNVGQLAGRAALQSAPDTNNGNGSKTPVDAPTKKSILAAAALIGNP